jgi:hypothetical protein
MQTDLPAKAERAYLHIFKSTIILLLSLALLGAAVFVLKAAQERSASAATIEPPKAAPKPSVDADAFVAELSKVDQTQQSSPMNTASKPAEDPDKALRQRVQRQIDVLYGHYQPYQVNCGIEADLRASREDFGSMFNEETMLSLLKEYGEEFFVSQADFVKAVLSNKVIVALCRSKGQRPQVFWPGINWHLKAWRESVERSASFASAEASRFASETADEEARVAQKHADARQSLQNAFMAFGVFMSIMMVLIFYKIQEGFQLVAAAIRERP